MIKARVTRTIATVGRIVAVFSAAAILLAPVVSQAAAPQVKTQAPGYYRMMLGDFEITAISDGTVTCPLDKLLTNTTPEKVKDVLARNSLTPQYETSINTFLINTGTRLLLVDTGAGHLFGPKAGGRLVSNLRAAGYKPEDIDAVLLTHIHGDHSGGLTIDGKAVFPNALIYVDKHEADFWLDKANEAGAEARHKHAFVEAATAFAPYLASGKLRTFGNGTELFPGIRTLETPGHTPGHSFYVVESRGQKMQLWGDVAHAEEVQFPSPEVTIAFDVDAPAAAKQRIKAFADAAKRGYWVAAAHFPFPGIGHVRRDGKAYVWVPVNYSFAGLQDAPY
ncbi:MBL fold metallo-hydrolase [Oryzomonas japonica]|uniref:MBL fold metallo-hydrolase n=1 Tax=Oryzomonas japonica TaxID=2603858 RepID=A0A7J4ZRV6_9BACT|nr:MBL fold metallo-hydrolase [Oryzomonas japonica]KAB0666004.1 MBL fold metallo-hydrolase [Oryzomonas japonica]